MRRTRAFTVVEMITVIAIMAILAVVLLPVLSRAREQGRKVACLSNLQQLGLGFKQYQQDWNRRYPLAGNYQSWNSSAHWVSGVAASTGEASGDSPKGTLASLEKPYEPTGNKADVEGGGLYPYVKNVQVYICPSNVDGREKGLSYSMNCAIAGISGVKIRRPAEIVVLVDEDKANDGYFFATNNSLPTRLNPPNPETEASGAPGTSTDALTQVHNGGGNLLFADGHVRYYDFQQFPLDSSPAGLENKYRQGGVPRFHDRAFGPKGSNVTGSPTQDSCFAPLS